MNIIEIYTENLDYKIRLKKEKRLYFLSQFSQYNITIEFINSIDQTLFTINTTEKEYVKAIEIIQNFINNFGQQKDDIIYFNNNGDFSRYFIYISMKNPLVDYPTDPIDEISAISIYHSVNDKSVLRLYFESSTVYLEQLAYNMYSLVIDIPYITEVINDNIKDMYEDSSIFF